MSGEIFALFLMDDSANMNIFRGATVVLVTVISTLTGCAGTEPKQTIDTLITAKHIYQGGDAPPIQGVVGITDGKIVFVGPKLPSNMVAKQQIDAGDNIVAPGFIDTHTHACNDFGDGQSNLNLNYTTQGVTTVFCSVDGGGPVDVAGKYSEYEAQGIGTNVALYIGHGSVRKAVMGKENRLATVNELTQMKTLVETAMQAGALGLSTGLYYVPGNYADLNEVVELAKVAARYHGVYDSHIRDESSYSIGLIAAIQEVITIGEQANISVHIAHIKALGVDVWGKSAEIVDLIDAARKNGVDVTADQYPWKASGTSVAGSLVPREVLSGSTESYLGRMKDEKNWPSLKQAMQENLRRRGGAESLLISDPKRPDIRGKNLQQVADLWSLSPIDAARKIIIEGNARVASFNMSENDIDTFMVQPWVMTSSDGSTGHPRKYATFPKKFHDYVQEKPLLTIKQFIAQSSTVPAKTFGLTNRGEIKSGGVADIVIFNPRSFAPLADYLHPEVLSEGVEWLLINGQVVIAQQQTTKTLAGQVIRHSQHSQ
jgi:N-acyl-D-aspartate/D-glutamate deacylase